MNATTSDILASTPQSHVDPQMSCEFLTGLLGNSGTVFLKQIVHGGCAYPVETFSLPVREEKMANFLRQAEERKASCYFILNEGEGAKDADIRRIRAACVDLDNPADLPAFREKLAAFPCPPTAEIETSKGRRQVFWALDECPVMAFQPLQKALAAHFGTDTAVSNPATLERFLR